jgi:hypothetical protein
MPEPVLIENPQDFPQRRHPQRGVQDLATLPALLASLLDAVNLRVILHAQDHSPLLALGKGQLPMRLADVFGLHPVIIQKPVRPLEIRPHPHLLGQRFAGVLRHHCPHAHDPFFKRPSASSTSPK